MGQNVDDSSSLHDNRTGLFFVLCRFLLFLNLVLNLINRLLHILQSASLARSAHVGDFLPDITRIFG